MYSILTDWTKRNINKILPEDDSAKFKAAWVTYMIANHANNNVFDFLKSKFEYALKNKLCIDDKQYIKDLGRHISLNYALNKKINLSLENNIMKLTFDIPEILQFMICNSIAKTIKENYLKEEQSIQIEIIKRLKLLWDRIISEFSKLNDDSKLREYYHKALKEFHVWYGCKFFHDNTWSLNHMHDLVVKRKIDMGKSFFRITKEALLADLQIHTRKVFEIVREHSQTKIEQGKKLGYLYDSELLFLDDIDMIVIKKVLAHIKNNNSLKHEKDAFVNKLAETTDLSYLIN